MFGALRQPVPYLGGNLLLNKEPAFFYHLAWDYMVFKGGEGGGKGDQSSPIWYRKVTAN